MRTIILSVLMFGGFAWGSCQDATGSAGQPSLGDLARQNKKAKQQEQGNTVVVADARSSRPAQSGDSQTPDERPAQSPSRLPDLVLQGGSNIEDIIQALEMIKQQRGPAEAEAALRRWYDKHDAMLLESLQSMDMDKDKSQTNPNGAVAAAGLQNVGTGLRIQAAFLRVIGEFPKLGFRPEWFRIQCNEGNLAPCR